MEEAMRKKLQALLTSLIIAFPFALYGMDIHDMQLQGSGSVNYLGFIKVYDAHLYTAPATLVDEVLAAESSRCLKLRYSVSLTRENFIEAAEKILNRQHNSSTLAKVKPQLDLLHSNYQQVKDGDSYTLCYSAKDRSTRLILNGVEQVAIPSAEFAEVYFGIWLGENLPLSEGLRADLLSGLKGRRS